MADTPSVLSPGVVVAETYEVESLLGKGGMGEVWLAKHLRLPGKQVAVKVLRLVGDITAELLARFKREAEIAARLSHPNIVQVLDYNTLPSGDPYLVMELLKGESLAARGKAGRMSPQELTPLMKQVGAALEAAHALGVVHRDLKPENIFLVPTALGNQVKVLDFGISKVADSNTVQTTDSVLVGTPLYMSPEQAMGNNSTVTAQSDIFSLASICYELLCGEPPFFAENIATVVFRIAYESPPPLRQRNPEVPEAMARAIEHALMKDRAARTPTVRAFVQELIGESLPGRVSGPDSVSGVLSPGMSVSESLLGGDTVSPSQAGVRMATPAPNTPHPAAASRGPASRGPATSPAPAAAPAPPAPAPSAGPSRLLVGAGVVLALAGVGAAYVFATRPSPAPKDPKLAMVTPPLVDAGAAEAPVDAGAPVAEAPDAGVKLKVVVVPPTPPPPEPEPKKLSAADQAVVDAFAAEAKTDRDPASINRKASSALSQLESKEGMQQVLLVQLRAACRLRDLPTINAVRGKLEDDFPRSLRRAAQLCRKEMGDAAPF